LIKEKGFEFRVIPANEQSVPYAVDIVINYRLYTNLIIKLLISQSVMLLILQSQASAIVRGIVI